MSAVLDSSPLKPVSKPVSKPFARKAKQPAVFKPMAHQLVSLKHSKQNKIVFDTSDPGTGKTAVRIWSLDERRKAHGLATLVLAPRSLLTSTWAYDIKRFAPHLTVSVATAVNREAAFVAEADVYITNTDAVKWLAAKKPAFFKKFGELIIDESTAYKHSTSLRSKAALKISKHFEYRTCMTGTPNSNSITDIWHQMTLLDGGKRLGPSFFAFRSTVCTPVQVGRSAQAIRWEDRDGAEEAVFSLLSDVVVRHKFEDCVDIPPNHQYPFPYTLTAKQKSVYFEVETTQMMMLNGKATVTAINAAAVATKLLQVASGAVYSAPDVYHVIDTGRYEMILDLIMERKHSLCFYLWKHQRDLLIKEADKRGVNFCVYDSSASDAERNAMITAYQAGAYQVMFAHPKSAAHGLTLTRGTATIWASPTYDLEIFKQGSKRQHRLGQTQKTETIIIVAQDTIEQKVYDTLLAKDARMSNLLDLFSTL